MNGFAVPHIFYKRHYRRHPGIIDLLQSQRFFLTPPLLLLAAAPLLFLFLLATESI